MLSTTRYEEIFCCKFPELKWIQFGIRKISVLINLGAPFERELNYSDIQLKMHYHVYTVYNAHFFQLKKLSKLRCVLYMESLNLFETHIPC